MRRLRAEVPVALGTGVNDAITRPGPFLWIASARNRGDTPPPDDRTPVALCWKYDTDWLGVRSTAIEKLA
jgi:hypothetical protein